MRSRYSSGDLLDFLLIAEMGSKLGDFDIDSFVSPSGATLHTAALFMAPFCANNASGWPYPHIHKQVEDLQLCRLSYRIAANRWQNESWENISQHAATEPGAQQRVLDLLRVNILAAGDDHVVDPAEHPEIAILVHPAQVAGEVPAVAN